MRKRIVVQLVANIFGLAEMGCSATSTHVAPAKPKDVLVGAIQGLKVDNILTSKLELVQGTEVVVSHVTIPAGTTLPKHWHPGEEFIYILQGSAIMWQKGKADMALKKRRRLQGASQADSYCHNR